MDTHSVMRMLGDRQNNANVQWRCKGQIRLPPSPSPNPEASKAWGEACGAGCWDLCTRGCANAEPPIPLASVPKPAFINKVECKPLTSMATLYQKKAQWAAKRRSLLTLEPIGSWLGLRLLWLPIAGLGELAVVGHAGGRGVRRLPR